MVQSALTELISYKKQNPRKGLIKKNKFGPNLEKYLQN